MGNGYALLYIKVFLSYININMCAMKAHLCIKSLGDDWLGRLTGRLTGRHRSHFAAAWYSSFLNNLWLTLPPLEECACFFALIKIKLLLLYCCREHIDHRSFDWQVWAKLIEFKAAILSSSCILQHQCKWYYGAQ